MIAGEGWEVEVIAVEKKSDITDSSCLVMIVDLAEAQEEAVNAIFQVLIALTLTLIVVVVVLLEEVGLLGIEIAAIDIVQEGEGIDRIVESAANSLEIGAPDLALNHTKDNNIRYNQIRTNRKKKQLKRREPIESLVDSNLNLQKLLQRKKRKRRRTAISWVDLELYYLLKEIYYQKYNQKLKQ